MLKKKLAAIGLTVSLLVVSSATAMAIDTTNLQSILSGVLSKNTSGNTNYKLTTPLSFLNNKGATALNNLSKISLSTNGSTTLNNLPKISGDSLGINNMLNFGFKDLGTMTIPKVNLFGSLTKSSSPSLNTGSGSLNMGNSGLSGKNIGSAGGLSLFNSFSKPLTITPPKSNYKLPTVPAPTKPSTGGG